MHIHSKEIEKVLAASREQIQKLDDATTACNKARRELHEANEESKKNWKTLNQLQNRERLIVLRQLAEALEERIVAKFLPSKLRSIS